MSFYKILSRLGNYSRCSTPAFRPTVVKNRNLTTRCQKEGEKPKKREFKSMWENPECCNNPCPDMVPRMDDKHYKPSDKLTRKYTRTWVECPRIKIAPRKICCFENVELPPIVRRPRKKKKPICKANKTNLMLCNVIGKSKCPKILTPGCPVNREPPKCKREKAPSGCLKKCAPYPSFSECRKDKPRPKRPVECGCLTIPMMCEVWAEYRRQQLFKR